MRSKRKHVLQSCSRNSHESDVAVVLMMQSFVFMNNSSEADDHISNESNYHPVTEYRNKHSLFKS
jgi:hypothetical protein